MMDARADRLKSRLASLSPTARNRVEIALRARSTEIQTRRNAALLVALTPIERKTRMSEITDELRRRIETGSITDPAMLDEARAVVDGLDRHLLESQ